MGDTDTVVCGRLNKKTNLSHPWMQAVSFAASNGRPTAHRFVAPAGRRRHHLLYPLRRRGSPLVPEAFLRGLPRWTHRHGIVSGDALVFASWMLIDLNPTAASSSPAGCTGQSEHFVAPH